MLNCLKNVKKLVVKKIVSQKVVAGVFLLLLVAAVVPLLMMGKYDHPSADDFGYGMNAHYAMLNEGSFGDVLQAALLQVKTSYDTWQGTFTSIFFMALVPCVFSETAYGLTPYLMIGSLLLGVFYVWKVILINGYQAKTEEYLAVAAAVGFMVIEFVYTPNSGFFWYNAAVHYTFMYGCMLLMLGFSLRLLLGKLHKARLACCILLSSLFAFLCGGSNYICSLFGLIMMVSLLIIWLLNRKLTRTNEGSWKQTGIWMFLPTIVNAISFYFNVTAPGNVIRSGNYRALSPLQAILSSFGMAFSRTLQWFSLLTLCMMLLLIPTFWQLASRINKSGAKRFGFWKIIFVYSICLFASTFTPEMYASGTNVIPRAINVSKFTFELLLFFNEFYLIGWLNRNLTISHSVRNEKLKKLEIPHNIWYYGILCIVAGAIFMATPTKEAYYPTYAAYYYIRAGLAQGYENEYQARMTKIKENKMDVVVEEYTLKPHLVYNASGEITSDSTNWLNSSIQNWYQKNSITLQEK